ncbi:MAG: diphthine--ammonia ligase [Elusimicrobia bacterium]|nr:diphthine--ammonia ligase [Elusimicrobiota bacterium]
MKTGVLWTGGKDSALAMREAADKGHQIACLITFAPPRPSFLAHPLKLMACQARALGLPHHRVAIRTPYRRSYEKAIGSFKSRFGLDALATGDIAEVDGRPNWIRQCGERSGLKILTPLWGWDRTRVLQRLIRRGFKAVFSCVQEPWLTPDWIGRGIDKNALAHLQLLSARSGLDVAGEQGEYHTMVLDGPGFRRAIRLDSFSVRRKGRLTHLHAMNMSNNIK